MRSRRTTAAANPNSSLDSGHPVLYSAPTAPRRAWLTRKQPLVPLDTASKAGGVADRRTNASGRRGKRSRARQLHPAHPWRDPGIQLGETTMLRKLLLASALLAIAPAARRGRRPAARPGAQLPYAALPDKPTCTKADLQAATDAYVAAQKSGDVSGMPLADNAHYLENMQTVDKGEGDVDRQAAGGQRRQLPRPGALQDLHPAPSSTRAAKPYVIGTRLYLHQGKILKVDSLVTHPGDWLFNANAYLTYSTKEDWGDLKPGQKTAPAEMIRGANAYLDSFADKFTEVPWGTPCARLEGGAYTNRDNKPDASCNVGIPAGVLYIVNRDYVIDPDKGVINVFCRFGNSTSGMPDSHTFRYVDGKIHAVHTLSVNLRRRRALAPGQRRRQHGAAAWRRRLRRGAFRVPVPPGFFPLQSGAQG